MKDKKSCNDCCYLRRFDNMEQTQIRTQVESDAALVSKASRKKNTTHELQNKQKNMPTIILVTSL